MNNNPNVGSVNDVRTTDTSKKEERLKVEAGATPKKKKRIKLQELISNYKYENGQRK